MLVDMLRLALQNGNNGGGFSASLSAIFVIQNSSGISVSGLFSLTGGPDTSSRLYMEPSNKVVFFNGWEEQVYPFRGTLNTLNATSPCESKLTARPKRLLRHGRQLPVGQAYSDCAVAKGRITERTKCDPGVTGYVPVP